MKKKDSQIKKEMNRIVTFCLAAVLTTTTISPFMNVIAEGEDEPTPETVQQETEVTEQPEAEETEQPEVEETEQPEEVEIETIPVEDSNTEVAEEQTPIAISQEYGLKAPEGTKDQNGYCFVSGVQPGEIIIQEQSGEGWNTQAFGTLRPDQFDLSDAFQNMTVDSVTVSLRDGSDSIADEIVLHTSYEVNAGGVDGNGNYVMDMFHTGKVTLSSETIGNTEERTLEIPVVTPNVSLSELKADGVDVTTVPSTAKEVTGKIVVDGTLENSYFFSADANAEGGKKKDYIAIMKAMDGFSASSIKAGEIGGSYKNEVSFTVQVKDISSQNGIVSIPEDENIFHTSLAVNIPIEEVTQPETVEPTQEPETSQENNGTDDMKPGPVAQAVMNIQSFFNTAQENISLFASSLGSNSVSIVTNRTSFYDNERITSLTLKINGKATFDQEMIENLNVTKEYRQNLTFLQAFETLRITSVEYIDEKTIHLTTSGVVSTGNIETCGKIAMNFAILDGVSKKDDMTSVMPVETGTLTATNLEVDYNKVESIDSDTSTIKCTVQFPETEGVESYFHALASTKGMPQIALGGAFAGASLRSVTVNSQKPNEIDLVINIKNPPMFESYGTITVPSLYNFLGTDVTARIQVNVVQLKLTQPVTVEEAENGKQEYTLSVAVEGGTLPDDFNVESLATSKFYSVTSITELTKTNGKITGFVAKVSKKYDKTFGNVGGTLYVKAKNLLYPDEHVCNVDHGVSFEDPYVPSEESETTSTVDTSKMIYQAMTTTLENVGMFFLESNPFAATAVSITSALLGGFLGGDYDTAESPNKEVLDAIHNATEEIKAKQDETDNLINHKFDAKDFNEILDKATYMSSHYYESNKFQNALYNVATINAVNADMTHEQKVAFDEAMQSIYSTQKNNEELRVDLTAYSNKLLSSSTSGANAFDLYSAMCEYRYAFNNESFVLRRNTVETLTQDYEMGYAMLTIAMQYDAAKNGLLKDEYAQLIKDRLIEIQYEELPKDEASLQNLNIEYYEQRGRIADPDVLDKYYRLYHEAKNNESTALKAKVKLDAEHNRVTLCRSNYLKKFNDEVALYGIMRQDSYGNYVFVAKQDGVVYCNFLKAKFNAYANAEDANQIFPEVTQAGWNELLKSTDAKAKEFLDHYRNYKVSKYDYDYVFEHFPAIKNEQLLNFYKTQYDSNKERGNNYDTSITEEEMKQLQTMMASRGYDKSLSAAALLGTVFTTNGYTLTDAINGNQVFGIYKSGMTSLGVRDDTYNLIKVDHYVREVVYWDLNSAEQIKQTAHVITTRETWWALGGWRSVTLPESSGLDAYATTRGYKAGYVLKESDPDYSTKKGLVCGSGVTTFDDGKVAVIRHAS